MNIDEPFASAGELVNQGQDPSLETRLRLLRVVPMAAANVCGHAQRSLPALPPNQCCFKYEQTL